jgi:hypothetical protein
VTDAQNELVIWLASLEAWSTFAAVLVTAVTVAALIYQIYLTRKSIAQSERSVTATQAALSEARKARIDQEMPKLTVVIDRQPGIGQGWTITNPNGAWGSPTAIDATREFVTPRDGAELLSSTTVISIRNSGPRPAEIEIVAKYEYGEKTHRILVGVDEIKTFDLVRVHSVGQWAEYTKFGEGMFGRWAGGPPPARPNGTSMHGLEEEIALVTYSFPGASGAVDTYRVVQTGALLDGATGNDSGWKLKDPAANPAWALRTDILPFERSYPDEVAIAAPSKRAPLRWWGPVFVIRSRPHKQWELQRVRRGNASEIVQGDGIINASDISGIFGNDLGELHFGESVGLVARNDGEFYAPFRWKEGRRTFYSKSVLLGPGVDNVEISGIRTATGKPIQTGSVDLSTTRATTGLVEAETWTEARSTAMTNPGPEEASAKLT